MDTQNTPVHLRLWHRDFWLLSLANLMLSSMVYMLIPIMPSHLMKSHGFMLTEVGAVVVFYALGLFLLGGFTSYLVQRYRRNVVCMLSIFALTLTISVMYFNEHLPISHEIEFWLGCVVALLMGALMGLAKMTLMSTLVIDTSESIMRTEANYISSWFGRVSLAIGAAIGLICSQFLDFRSTILVACAMGLSSIYFVRRAKFPFRAPEEYVSLYSTDRFFLLQGIPLFLLLAMVTMSAGLVVSTVINFEFFCFMFAGFVLSIISEKVVFSDADLKSEPITGLICMLLSLVMLLISQLPIVDKIIPVLFAFGVGIFATRFMLFLIKLSRHCQRGTSQSTYFLAWEFGLASGIALAYGVLNGVKTDIYLVALGLTVFVLLAYNFLLHPWYMSHRNR